MPQFAQCGEDYLVLSMLRSLALREGVDLTTARYLEIGANHPIAGNSTYLLHIGLGMTGVLVEANPKLIPDLASFRPHDKTLNLAITPENVGEVELYVASLNELSSLDPKHIESFQTLDAEITEIVLVSSITLDELMRQEFHEAPPLFLSIDIEGLDFSVLENYSFRFRPYVLQVEANQMASQKDLNEVKTILEKNDYQILASTDVNQIAIDIRRFQSEGLVSPLQTLGVNAEKLEVLLKKFDILSLDVFDTILARRTNIPTDVFFWMERRYSLPDFCQQRIFAEASARKKFKNRGSEVSLEEIYSNFSYSGSLPKNILKLELDAEALFCFVNPNVRALIDVARKLGKRVVAISDIYFSPNQIETLLMKVGIHLDHVYSSSDFRSENLGKYNGRIYGRVATLENSSCNQILHVGDNPISDIRNARVAGVTCILSRNLHEVVSDYDSTAAFVTQHSFKGMDRIIAGQVTSGVAKNSSNKRTPLERFGYAFGGPLVLGFLDFIQRTAKNDGVDRLVLLERDGCILADVANILPSPDVEMRLAPSSRRLAALPCLAFGDSRPLLNIFEDKLISDRSFFESLCLNYPSETVTDGELEGLPAQHLDRHWNLFSAQAIMELNALKLQYQEELEINSRGGKIAWVDVGWALSSAASLNQVLEISAPCYCVGSHKDVNKGIDNNGYLFESGFPSNVAHSVMSGPELIELIFTSTAPSTAYFKMENDGSTSRVTKPQPIEELLRNNSIEEVRRGVLDFAREFANLVDGLDPVQLRDLNRRIVSSLCSDPPREIYRSIALIPHDRLAGNQGWSTVGDFWEPNQVTSVVKNEQINREREMNAQIEELQKKLVDVRRNPLKQLIINLMFEVLRRLSEFSPPVPEKVAQRFLRSALKRDPRRK